MPDTQQSIQEMKPGDPRRIVAMMQSSTDVPQEEVLWGCGDSEESQRMANIIVNGGFLSITLNELGANAFAYLEEEKRVSGVKVPYFIHHFNVGVISEAPMLLGQFLFEFVNSPQDALALRPGLTNRIYFRMDGIQDKRVESYGFLSDEEVAEVREKLNELVSQYPEHQQNINHMLASLEK